MHIFMFDPSKEFEVFDSTAPQSEFGGFDIQGLLAVPGSILLDAERRFGCCGVVGIPFDS